MLNDSNGTSPGIEAFKLPDAQRRKLLNGIFVDRRSTDLIVNSFDIIRRDRDEGAECTCIAVAGPRGVGKTTFLKRYLDRPSNRPSVNDDGEFIQKRRPVLYVTFPPTLNLKIAAKSVLAALMDIDLPSVESDDALEQASVSDIVAERRATLRGDRDDLTRRIRLQLAHQRTELIILDEFQNVRSNTQYARDEVAAWVENLLKSTNVPMVLAGVEQVFALVNEGSPLHQLTSQRFKLAGFGYATASQMKTFQGFLSKLDRMLPFEKTGGLGSPELASRIHQASAGTMRPLKHLIRFAARLAIDEKAQAIEPKHLATAFDMLGGATGLSDNPFDDLCFDNA